MTRTSVLTENQINETEMSLAADWTEKGKQKVRECCNMKKQSSVIIKMFFKKQLFITSWKQHTPNMK